MFAANKSILSSFVKSQGVSYDQVIGSDDELYANVRNRTYNRMAASIISTSLEKYNIIICDPKPYSADNRAIPVIFFVQQSEPIIV